MKRALKPEDIPTDERYHWHYVGRARGSATLWFWAHHSWVFDHRLHMTHNPALPDPLHYDVYVSLKLEGPAYVPGSERGNAFSIDRLILVEVREDEPEGAL